MSHSILRYTSSQPTPAETGLTSCQLHIVNKAVKQMIDGSGTTGRRQKLKYTTTFIAQDRVKISKYTASNDHKIKFIKN